MAAGNVNETARRVIDAGTHLLDHQIVDKDGELAGKVDDLEFSFPEEGNLRTPFVTAILAGPSALAVRLGGPLGRMVTSIHAVTHPSERPEPARISFGVVKKVDNHVELIVSRDDLDVVRLENWVRERIISRIRGAHHAPQ